MVRGHRKRKKVLKKEKCHVESIEKKRTHKKVIKGPYWGI